MERDAVCQWLGIDEEELDALVAQGLPLDAPTRVIILWLVEHTDAQIVVATVGEVAEIFGVRRDTVQKEWRRAGLPGRKGRFDLRKILAWKRSRSRDPETNEPSSAATDALLEERKARLEVERRAKTAQARRYEIDAATRERELVKLSKVAAVFRQALALIATQWEPLPDRVGGMLPAGVSAEERRRVQADVERLVEQARAALADAIERLADEV